MLPVYRLDKEINKFTVAGSYECKDQTNSVYLSLKSHPLWVTL